MYVDNLKKQQQQCLNPVGFKNLNNYSLTINTYPNQKHPGASTLRQIIPMNYKSQLNESFLCSLPWQNSSHIQVLEYI